MGSERHGWLVIGLAAAGLMGAITLEVGSEAGGDLQVPALPRLGPSTPISAPASSAGDDGGGSAAKIVARPLFNANRRPTVTIAGVSLPTAMPRLTGVVVSPAGRFALFANSDGGRPLVMREGDRIGAAVIEAIAAGEVTVRGPDGAFVLRASFDEKVVQVSLKAPVALNKPAFPRLPTPFRAASRIARAN